MPFNAGTYHANRLRKEAREYLGVTRDVKARAAVGEAYEWELSRIATFVKLARLSNHMLINQLRINRL